MRMQNLPKEISLSARQKQCASYLLQGLTLKQMGEQMNLSPRTVEHYIENLKLKLACKNRTELIIKLTRLLSFI